MNKEWGSEKKEMKSTEYFGTTKTTQKKRKEIENLENMCSQKEIPNNLYLL